MPTRRPQSAFIVCSLLILVPSLWASDVNVVESWNNAALKAIQDTRLSAPEAARALAIVNTCMYDAWTAYDARAYGTQLKDLLRRPPFESTDANKGAAISYAAFHALKDVLPVDTDAVYLPLLKRLKLDSANDEADLTTPSGIANVACDAVLEFRHHDNSNQLGDLSPGAYSDWTGYTPHNKPTALPIGVAPADPNHWQPLTFVNESGERVTQRFADAQWSHVKPFALKSCDQFRALMARMGPAQFATPEYVREVDETIAISADLSDRDKIMSEFWADGIYTEQPAGHWFRIAQWVSNRDHQSLDQDVKLFFVLSNAMLDAGIAAWDTKVAFDSVRPVTAVTTLYKGQAIRAWGGPGRGTVSMDGSQWLPYQPTDAPTPSFPEFVSGHSAYSAAAATTLRMWTGSDVYGGAFTVRKGESKIEPGITPRTQLTLHWNTFTDAAVEAGMSRRYGGIHFRAGDEAGRLLGDAVAQEVWKKSAGYFGATPRSLPYSASLR